MNRAQENQIACVSESCRTDLVFVKVLRARVTASQYDNPLRKTEVCVLRGDGDNLDTETLNLRAFRFHYDFFSLSWNRLEVVGQGKDHSAVVRLVELLEILLLFPMFYSLPH